MKLCSPECFLVSYDANINRRISNRSLSHRARILDGSRPAGHHSGPSYAYSVQPTEVAVAGPESFCHEQEVDPVVESATYVKSLAGGLSNIIGYRWGLTNAIVNPLIPDENWRHYAAMLHLAAIGIRDDDGLPHLFPGLR